MRGLIVTGVLIATALGFTSMSWAFSCPTQFQAAKAAIARATKAMDAMSDKGKQALVHTLLDDAKMLLHSARHNHSDPTAGAFDHARALAKADSAESYAEAALELTKH